METIWKAGTVNHFYERNCNILKTLTVRSQEHEEILFWVQMHFLETFHGFLLHEIFFIITSFSLYTSPSQGPGKARRNLRKQ